MRQLVEEGMKDGAFGFSTGLTYTPGAYSDTTELVQLAGAVRAYGGMYITHARYSLGDKLLDPFREAVTVGREAGVPVQISHYHNPVDGMGERMLALVDEARNEGVDVTFDQYPYPAASTLLLSLVPHWVHAGGPRRFLERIKTRAVRDQIQDAISSPVGRRPEGLPLQSHRLGEEQGVGGALPGGHGPIPGQANGRHGL